MDESLISRDEVIALLFNVSDMAVSLRRIERLLEDMRRPDHVDRAARSPAAPQRADYCLGTRAVARVEVGRVDDDDVAAGVAGALQERIKPLAGALVERAAERDERLFR